MHTVALLVESNFRDIVDIDWSKRHWSVVREQEAKCCSILYTVIGVIKHAVWPYGRGKLAPAAIRDLYRVPGVVLAEPRRIRCGAMWCDGSREEKNGAYPVSVGEKKGACPVVHGHLFSEFYTRQGSQPLLAALAG